MTNKKTFFMKLKRIVLCFMVLFMLEKAVAPKEAQAFAFVTNISEAITEAFYWIKDKVQWFMKETALGKIIGSLIELYTLFMDKFGEIIDSINKYGALEFMSERLILEAEIRTKQAEIDAAASDAKAEVFAEIAAEQAYPPHQGLCRSVLVNELVTTTEDFEREVSRMAAEAINNRARCSTCGGPSEAAMAFARRMDQKTLSPLDGLPKGVASGADAPKGTQGQAFADADVQGLSTQILEMPKFVRQRYTDETTNTTIDVLQPDPKTTIPEQRFFNAKLDWLFNITGTRPTPVSGKNLLTPTGLVQRAMYNHCAANQNALIKQCTDLFAYYTRPNRDDPKVKDLRDMQNQRCEAITGVIDKKRFGDCKVGLSAYETQLLVQTWCKSVKEYIKLKGAGASDPEAINASDICTMSWTEWQQYRAQKRANCMTAISAMASLAPCWAAVSASGPGGAARISAPAQDAVLPSPFHEINDNHEPAANDGLLHAINAKGLMKNIPQGKPISFDEMELPQAVGQ